MHASPRWTGCVRAAVLWSSTLIVFEVLLVILSGENGLDFQLCPCSVPVSPLSRVSFFCSILACCLPCSLSSCCSLSLFILALAHSAFFCVPNKSHCHWIPDWRSHLLLFIFKCLSFSPSYLFLMPGQGWQWGTDFCLCEALSWFVRSVWPYDWRTYVKVFNL